MITYKSTKLSTKIFRVVYRNKCPDEGCKDDYIGKTNSIIVERIQYHNIRGKKEPDLVECTRGSHSTFAVNSFFAITLKNCKLCCLKLN